MKATRFFQIALLILGLCCAIACNEDEVQDTDLILGRWDLREGLRNGSPTESLADLFFEFYEEGKMRTNITGSPVDCSYDIEGDQLEQRGGPMDINYTIQMLNDTMLSLTAKIHSYDFKLEMARTLQEE